MAMTSFSNKIFLFGEEGLGGNKRVDAHRALCLVTEMFTFHFMLNDSHGDHKIKNEKSSVKTHCSS